MAEQLKHEEALTAALKVWNTEILKDWETMYVTYLSRSEHKGLFTLCVNVCDCTFENNRRSGKRTQTQKIGSTPILFIIVNITIGTMLKFKMLKFDADVNIDAQCEQTLSFVHTHRLRLHFHQLSRMGSVATNYGLRT